MIGYLLIFDFSPKSAFFLFNSFFDHDNEDNDDGDDNEDKNQDNL